MPAGLSIPQESETLLRNQFLACLGELYFVQDFSMQNLSDAAKSASQDWALELRSDLWSSNRGYATKKVKSEPTLELAIHEWVKKFAPSLKPKPQLKPALCLTHDIDYLKPTLQLKLKRAILKGGFSKNPSEKSSYLDSLRQILEIDQRAAGRQGASGLFIPAAAKSKNLLKRIRQWVIDPSFSLQSSEFSELEKLVHEFQCQVGIHGSYFSLTDRLLSQELKQLSTRLGLPILSGRQHWLNLPQETLGVIKEAGIQIDSTLGWNGQCGYRCGMARPFPLMTSEDASLWEVPLLLMDGPIFDDQKLKPDEAFEYCRKLLKPVISTGGCVAINWHERSAHADYQWVATYEKLLEACKREGFEFLSLSEALCRHSPAI